MIQAKNCTFLLLLIIFLQFLVIIYLLSTSHHQLPNDQVNELGKLKKLSESIPEIIGLLPTALESSNKLLLGTTKSKYIRGVAVTLMLHTPTWFQRRYTYMVQNAHNNIPEDWVIQIFYTGEGQSLHGLDINPWIRTLMVSGRVVLTVIPKHILKQKKRRVELMTEKWVWENMLADHVLIFGGSSVICSNSPWNITQFTKFDYIGAPWNSFHGAGGDGGVSTRNRNVMLAVLAYEAEKQETKGLSVQEKTAAYKQWGQEDHFFVSRMLEILKIQRKSKQNMTIALQYPTIAGERMMEVDFGKVLLASRNETRWFAGNSQEVSLQNFAMLGTLPAVSFQLREQVIAYCPEIKMHYPALHDPNCFGASPDGEKCALNICALKPRTERKGGC